MRRWSGPPNPKDRPGQRPVAEATTVEVLPPAKADATPDPKLLGLASEIRGLHESFIDYLNVTIDRAMALGDVLSEAKPLVGHGRWLKWLSTNTQISESECQRYMQLARNRTLIEA